MGLDPDLFWRMTWSEFYMRAEGYFWQLQQEWHKHRLLLTMIHNVNSDKAHQLKPEEMIPLPMDKDYHKQVHVKSDSEVEDMIKQAEQRRERRRKSFEAAGLNLN